MQRQGNQIQFTGIVVTYNEERHLLECLESLRFCDQMIVIDLGSSDDSIEIAKQCGAEVMKHEWVPIADQIKQEIMSYVTNDWVIFIDPDEVFPVNVENELKSMINKHSNLGRINIPWQFYFKRKPLNFTRWGMEKSKGVVLHKNRNRFNPLVHQGDEIICGHSIVTLSRKSDNFIKHYWVDSYSQLFEKHWRYIKLEGEARYQQGKRFSWGIWIKDTLTALKYNLFDYNGLHGGFSGIFLSTFYAWYEAMSLLALRQYQRCIEKGKKQKQ